MMTTNDENRAKSPRRSLLSPATILTKRQRRGLYVGLSITLFVLLVGSRLYQEILNGFGYNMDLIFYTGCALEFEYDDIETVHKETYEAIRKSVSRRHFKFLTAKNWKRKLHHKEAEHFANMLPFYRSRVMFTGGMYLLHKAGVPVADSAKVINAGAYAVAALLMLLWLSRRFSWIIGPLTSAGFLSAPYLTKTAGLATPDVLLTMWLIGSLFVLIELKKKRTGLVLLLFSLLIRPDSIIFVVLLVPALRLFSTEQPIKLSNIWTVGLLLSAVGTYLFTKVAMDGHGWWTVLQYTNHHHNAHLDQLSASFNFQDYFDILIRRLKHMTEGTILPHLGLAAVGIYAAIKRGPFKPLPQYTVPLVVIVLCSIARFILFPVLWDRLYLAYCVAIELLVFSALSYRLTAQTSEASPSDTEETPIPKSDLGLSEK